MTTPPDPDVSELRAQLRALGYLDARVDRFVLGAASRAEHPAKLAAIASGRVGLLAGLLLGPSAAIGLRARAPELVTNAADAAIAAGYLALLFGVAAAILVGTAVWIGALVARRAAAHADFPRRATRAAAGAGVVVAAGGLLYLTLWWRTAAALTGESSAVWTGAALAVGVGISLLLGHAVTLTILAVIARLGLGRSLERGLPLSSRRAVAAMATVALGGAVGLLLATTAAPRPAPAPALTVVPTGERVVVVAIDGLDRDTLQRLVTAGRLPTIARWLRGASAPIAPTGDVDPARVWTTIATGQPPARHGIQSLENREVAGLGGRLRSDSGRPPVLTRVTDLLRLTRPSIASGTERLVPAFWEVAARAGLRTAVVHWWATWPAPDDMGVVITDRAILRLEHGGQAQGEIAPASLYTELLSTWHERRTGAAAAAAGLSTAGLSDAVAETIRRSATLDATLVQLARDARLDATDLTAVYLPGLDIAQHALLGAGAGGLTPEAAAERLTSLERYYEFLDVLIAPLVTSRAGSARTAVLVTQPGRVDSPAPGVMAISGPIASTLAGREASAVTSVMPTVLYALGVPIADDLPSQPQLALFDASFVARHPVRRVSTYGARISPPRPRGQPLDQEMIERMRSLGYVR